MISFLYTSRFSVPSDDANAKIKTFSYYSTFPHSPVENPFNLDMNYTQFLMSLYGMGEALKYPQLMSYVFSRLVQYFVYDKKDQECVKELIKIVFEPASSPDRLCKDEVGALKELGIAAVLVHEKLHWPGAKMDYFRDLLAEELDQSTWKKYRKCYKQTKDMNGDLMSDKKSGMASLTSAMGKVDLGANQPATVPNIVEMLHSLFDDYAFWSMKGLCARTGQPKDLLYKALYIIAQQTKEPPYTGFWQRKSKFNRPSKWSFPDPNRGRVPSTERAKKPQDHAQTHPSSSRHMRTHDSPQSMAQSQPSSPRMHANGIPPNGTGHQSSPKHFDVFDAPSGSLNISTSSDRDIASPGDRSTSRSPSPTIIIVSAPGKSTNTSRGSTPDTRLIAPQHAPKDTRATEKAEVFKTSYGQRFVSNITSAQMQALEDAGVARKTPERIRKMSKGKKDNIEVKTMPTQTGFADSKQTIVLPTVRTFGGVGGNTMDFDFNAAPSLHTPSFSFRGLKDFQGQSAGSTKKSHASIRKKLYDPERNKENIPWYGSEDDSEMDEDETMGGVKYQKLL